ncbi:MAG: flippase-like domain-containing protein [Actinobacteria bacterium]|nr:flippase-like domain-containing protein [Actinomycetota bacterium]
MPVSLVQLPLGDLASSLQEFFNAATEFFRHLSEVHWTPFGLALLCLLGMQLARSWAWRNVLQAAYPGKRVGYTRVAAAYLVGSGINAVIPAHAGDVTKVFLVKRQIPDSSYPAVTSSFLVQTVFDTSVGILVLLYAFSQGLLPPLPELPHLPAFEVSFWASHPQTLAIAAGVLILAIVVGVWLLAHRVRRFWARVRQGVVILSRPRDYMRQVFAWQGVGWLFRFAAFWFFLEAFGLQGSIGNVMLVMSVQAIANIIPFTPGGAGAQQALLVATLNGPSRAAVLSFSVGTQIAMGAWSIVLGFAAILLVFRTTDWRGLIKQAQDEASREDEGGAGGEGAGSEAATPSSA